MRINHNISAQLANVSLKRADKKVSSALQNLSSGYKINKAADDSAGLAISNKMRTQIRALDQASRNSDDGISVIRTAEGALAEIEAILQRTRELAVQAANDTNVIEDRYAAQMEIDSLLDEVDRIASTTEFNGTFLLDGSCNRVVTYDKIGIQSLGVSSGVKEGTYKLTVNQLATSATGTVNYTVGVAGSVKINDVVINYAATDTSDEIYAKIDDVCNKMNIHATKNGNSVDLKNLATGSENTLSYRSYGNTKDTVSKGVDANVTIGTGADSMFNGNEAITYSGNNIIITNNSGFEMKLCLEDGAVANKDYELQVYNTGAMKFQIGANEHQDIDIDFAEVSCRALQLREEVNGEMVNRVNICTQQGASRAISSFDQAIRSISEYRSNLGAYENRLDSTISSLDVSSENMTDAMSRIMDTDMAEAMTRYTQNDVLSQAATSMLAQANNRPQHVLTLLQS